MNKDQLEQALQEARDNHYYLGSIDYCDEKDIIAAAHIGNFDLVKHLFENGVDINIGDNIGHTALFEAIKWDHHQIVEFLMQNGADINHRDELCTQDGCFGCTAILYAKNEEMINLLLNYGANIDDIGLVEGKGLLHKAVERSDQNRINFLLSRNASIDLEMQNGMTSLMIAVNSGNIDIVRLLVSSGSDVNHREKIGVSVLQLAKLSGNKEVENFLIENGAIDNCPRVESLEIFQPDDYGVDNYFMGATKAIETDDGTIHVFFYGTGFASRWYDLAGCRRIYLCVKDNKLLYHFAGREHGWYHFEEYDDEGQVKSLKLGNGTKDLVKNFPKIKADLKDCKIPPKAILKFKPNEIDGIDIDAEFASLKNFFNEYVEIIEIEVKIPGSNFTFFYPMPRFTDKGVDFCGEVTYSESSNSLYKLPRELYSKIGNYYRI